MNLSWVPSSTLTRNNRDRRALPAVTAPKFCKTETPNNGICIIIASSVCVKVPSCSQLKLLIPIWALAVYIQPERGRFISLRTTILAVCALPAPENGGAGNGTDTTAVQLFRIWKSPYFDFEIYTCLERLGGSSKWKEMDLYRVWWPCWRFSAQKRAKPKPPIILFICILEV